MPLNAADHSQDRSPGSRIVAGIGALFYLLTSLPTLALFCVMAVWDKITGNDDN